MLKVMCDWLLTYEPYDTLLICIEAYLNSCPRYVESSDSNEFNSLTPGHFPIGRPLTALLNPDISESS